MFVFLQTLMHRLSYAKLELICEVTLVISVTLNYGEQKHLARC